VGTERRINDLGFKHLLALPSVTASKGGLAKGKALVNEESILVGSVYAPEERG
jgi:hypothetical protein